MTRSWEEMLSNPIEGEEYNGQVSESKEYNCDKCGVESYIEDYGCPYCDDTLCPACCVEGKNKQVSESEQPLEPLCGDHLVPVSQCDCLWGYKRARGSK